MGARASWVLGELHAGVCHGLTQAPTADGVRRRHASRRRARCGSRGVEAQEVARREDAA
jgi:hypothetical protein